MYDDVKDINTRSALKYLDGKLREIEKNYFVDIPVVDPNGSHIREMHPRNLEFLPVYEKRYLKDLVRWLEEVLDCKFQVIRTKDVEGAFEDESTD